MKKENFEDNKMIRDGKIIISKAMRNIRKNKLFPCNESGHYIIPSDDGTLNQSLFWIPTKGCSYALSESGGCTMCNFGGSQKKLTDEELLKELILQLEHPDIKYKPVVNFGGQGSFFDNNEFSPYLREKILNEISKRDWIKVFVFESRPEFATREKMRQLREKLGDKFIELGIGIESTNPLILEGIINKGFNIRKYTELIDYCKEFEIWLSLHVIFKPNVLTEKESIEDSVTTIKELLKDVDEIHPILRIILMIMNIKPNTLIEWAYKKGVYKPPMLWSCIEVLKRLSEDERCYVKVLGFDTGVKPLLYASNGDDSDNVILESLKQFARDHKISPLIKIEKRYKDSVSRKKWEKIINESPKKSLRERIKEFHSIINKEFP